MFYHLISVFFAILQVFGNIVYACNHSDVSFTLLDVATEMIAKAKLNIPVCPTSSARIITKPIDCEEVLSNGHSETGVYTVWPRSRVSDEKSFQVYCDMDTNGGGWTVIQRRGDFGRARDYFFKDWESYKKGFGDIEKDFWFGNDNIFALTSQRLYSIRFDLKVVDGEAKYALYDTFWIDDEDHNYTLHIKNYSGNAGDSIVAHHDNAKFSTKDVDNDNYKNGNCALTRKGAWWYNNCHHSNLNGLYWKGYHESVADGVNWYSCKNMNESLEFTEMKIRPSNFIKK
ncbi:techylectin-like protein [Argiope bruennichi]|uniref:techylectin-like protein n=1 Tax=Argiope bruennichi TaxID=94029 RepID=UPI00249539C0|nr:techylectin-like protein [Argiope bruennichi]